jgi:branched-chain amino acid aminotransferase
MNQFWYWKSAVDGQPELVTAPLDGTILPGVTRDSIIQLAKSWGIRVREEQYTIYDVISAIKDGRMIESFGSGTAAIVSPVKAVGFDGVDYDIPLDKDDKEAQAGPLTQRIADTIMGIQYGKVTNDTFADWSVIVN